ncbi:MAG: hypothetical protein L3J83_01130 [Proteobacteria bacterium]|nr:hypothetical protein [Pseudomonadota bacterium]
MKSLFIILLILLSYSAHSAVVIWPDSTAPCNGTLQACINSAAIGDIVEIHTSDPINESLFIGVPISVVAGSGYQPIFTTGNFINLADATTGPVISVSIRGLTFQKGAIYITALGRPIIFYIENNTILDNIVDESGINIQVFTESDIVVHINYNHVLVDTSGSTVAPLSGILVQKSVNGAGLGAVTGEIYNNTIQVKGNNASGILIVTGNDSDINMNITGNEIAGGTNSSIHTRRSSSSGTSIYNINSNVMFPNQDDAPFAGININNSSGATQADIVNNTIVKAVNGVILTESSGTLSANVYNNLLSHSTTGFRFGSTVSVSNDNNLLYENAANINYSAGVNMISVNPLFAGFNNFRLSAASPALEAGSSLGLVFVADSPFIDADGLIRVKKGTIGAGSGQVDIGAYEAGDVSFNHVSASINHVTVIDNNALNNMPSLDSLHVTSNANPNGAVSGVFNNDNEGLFYAGGTWRVFNENFVNLTVGTSFNITKYASVLNTFTHSATSTSNTTVINNSGLNLNPEKMLQVSQHWTGDYNPHPFGILYFGGNWVIVNLDLSDIPVNASFNVYFQEQSKSAFRHTATVVNTFTNFTNLSNPLINGISCAQIQVTQSTEGGVFNASPVGVFYNTITQRWAVFNQDSNDIAVNTTFHVLIDPAQVERCSNPLLFKDGFE